MSHNRFEQAEDIPALIHMVVGAGSMCWENPGGAGVFDDTEAREVAKQAIARLAEMGISNEPFEVELERLLNRHSIENESDTPDYTLAEYLRNCLDIFSIAVCKRDAWHGFTPWLK